MSGNGAWHTSSRLHPGHGTIRRQPRYGLGIPASGFLVFGFSLFLCGLIALSGKRFRPKREALVMLSDVAEVGGLVSFGLVWKRLVRGVMLW